jgi:hypothetical protein
MASMIFLDLAGTTKFPTSRLDHERSAFRLVNGGAKGRRS